MTKYIKADEFYYPYHVKGAGYLAIEGDSFGDWQAEAPHDADIIDYTGFSVAPGLVDTHIHGFAGVDVMDNHQEVFETMSKALLGAGVTSFLPTALTASFEILAPERDEVEDFIDYATRKNVIVALGHSDATYQQAAQAVEAGASVWVHAYNGMRGLNHREPGMVGAVYELPNTYAELICDGHHVHPSACDILMHQKDHEHVVLITDCMSAGGLEDGDYMLGEFPVIVEKGTARLKSNGALAGSILQLKDAVKNVVNWGIASKAQAISMASLTAAISVGIDDRCGQIKKGYKADFIVLDKDLDLRATYLGGQEAWKA